MLEGNRRFIIGDAQHPRQDVAYRQQNHHSQNPPVALFGCSDSRLAAELIFDKGLGDLFVVRNAGQVVSDTVIGSLEYAVAVLKVSLIVVLAHDQCGAIAAAVQSQQPDPPELPVNIARQIQPIIPAVQEVWLRDNPLSPRVDPDLIDTFEVGRAHLRGCVAELLRTSALISNEISEGRLGIVAANYRLAEGLVEASTAIGPVNTV
ncbi:carbonic anhydrase [Nakamurella silvestris]|nr:carbonic anhydrase [Nakamurella silvestris]